MSNSLVKYFTTNHSAGSDLGLLLFRLTFALVLLYGHGLDKLMVIIKGQEIQFMDPIGIGMKLSFYLAAFAEGVCAILLVLGLFTRFAALTLTINFIVILVFHGLIVKDAFNILEIRFLYLLSYFALIFTGAGRYSLDAIFMNRK